MAYPSPNFGTGKTTAEPPSPIGYGGIYAEWNEILNRDIRHDYPYGFGIPPMPVLKYDGHGVASSVASL